MKYGLSLEIFGKPEPDRFPVHKVVVTHAFWNEEEEEAEYDHEIIHPPECDHEECAVWWEIHEAGSLENALLGYAWRDEERAYPWVTTYYVRYELVKHDIPGEPIEYDGGMYVSLKEDEV